MPEFEKIMDNYEPPEIIANFFVLHSDEESCIEGWISMEPSLEEFIALLQEEIEYSWGIEDSHMADYNLFHIDLEDKNNMKEINDNDYYLFVREHPEIFIVVLHKSIKYRIIENIPAVFEWFMETL
ncbi:MAG: hypothetical protein ACFFE5_09350 [Candidatus Thorarchaeota archaeon]